MTLTEQRKQAKALAKMRAAWVRDNDRRDLARLREALAARSRRDAALRKVMKACAKGRAKMARRIQAYRSAEFRRINAEVREMRLRARAQCQARRYRIRQSGGRAVERQRAELGELARYQRQIERLSSSRQKRRLSTLRERREEDDDAVRSNLPRELVPVFERVRKHIKGDKRTTRTEAFLEWAESHPEDVIAFQGDDAEREVRRLVAEHEAAERRLRKTRGRRAARRAAVSDVPF
jgi:hypothetical protein